MSSSINLSSATSTAVDLSRLPPPDIIEALDFETILATRTADFLQRYPEFSAFVESDPAIKLLEVAAFQELNFRQRANDAARACMLAYAGGSDLDNLAALFGVTRRVLIEADAQNNTAPVLESDTDLRRRTVLAPDSYSVAGPASAYVFYALSADGDVLDASATSPAAGEVVVSILSREGDGTASAELIASVDAVLNADTVRPLTDLVTVQTASITTFDITAQLTLYPGPDAQLMLGTANAELDTLIANNRRIGRDMTRSAIIAALHVGGVQNVNLIAPAADVVIDQTSAAAVGNRSVTVTGFGE